MPLLLKDHACISQSHQWDTPLYHCCTLVFLLCWSGLCQRCPCSSPLNPKFGHCILACQQMTWLGLGERWSAGLVRRYQRIYAEWQESRRFHVQTIIGPYVNPSILGSFKPVADSSCTQGARCPASARTILDTSHLLIAVPAFIELQPNGGKWQVQGRSGGTSHWVYFYPAGGCCLRGPPLQEYSRHVEHFFLTSCWHSGRCRVTPSPTGPEGGPASARRARDAQACTCE